ncbi:hypothetical protein DER46DRAFT_613105 [Fusarium sp. MPI-SDFR-AT-0072]|nr:hypothetical protein DER46DRAFT_613105 [Fusarium sp. MPI-SDFR-AT-0072]
MLNNRFRYLTAIGYKNVDLNAMVEEVSVHDKISQGAVKNTDDTVMQKVRPSVNLDLHPPVALAQQSYPSISKYSSFITKERELIESNPVS